MSKLAYQWGQRVFFARVWVECWEILCCNEVGECNTIDTLLLLLFYFAMLYNLPRRNYQPTGKDVECCGFRICFGFRPTKSLSPIMGCCLMTISFQFNDEMCWEGEHTGFKVQKPCWCFFSLSRFPSIAHMTSNPDPEHVLQLIGFIAD